MIFSGTATGPGRGAVKSCVITCVLAKTYCLYTSSVTAFAVPPSPEGKARALPRQYNRTTNFNLSNFIRRVKETTGRARPKDVIRPAQSVTHCRRRLADKFQFVSRPTGGRKESPRRHLQGDFSQTDYPFFSSSAASYCRNTGSRSSALSSAARPGTTSRGIRNWEQIQTEAIFTPIRPTVRGK